MSGTLRPADPTPTPMSDPPCAVTPTQRLLLKPMMAGTPVSQKSLIAHLYGWRWDGGPEYAEVGIRMHISRLRRRLAPHGIDLLTIGGATWTKGYMIDPDHVPRLTALLAATGRGLEA